MRPIAFSLVSFVCLALACSSSSEAPPPAADRGGGAGGAGAGGAPGSGAGNGGAAPIAGQGGAGVGAGGSVGTGGSVGAGATGGSAGGDAAAIDAPAGLGGAAGTTPDASADAGDGGPVDPNDPSTWPGGAFNKSFIILCPDGAPKATCCKHYCTCMTTYCGKQIPADCLNACMASDKWDLRCRVYNCFESQNPNAKKDTQAHCEHAGVYTGSQRTRGAGDTHTTCHKPGEPDEN